MIVPVTSFFSGILGLMYMVLSFLVVRQRRKLGVSIGDGVERNLKVVYEIATSNNSSAPYSWAQMTEKFAPLSQAIRTHANFAEYVPFSLLMLGLLELNRSVAHITLVYLGTVLVLSRILHFLGLYTVARVGPNLFRFLGALSSFLLLGTLAALLIFSSPLPSFL